jgi:hypothetical protein
VSNNTLIPSTTSSGPWPPSKGVSILLEPQLVFFCNAVTLSLYFCKWETAGFKQSSDVSRAANQALFLAARSSPMHLRGFLDISIFTGSVSRPVPKLEDEIVPFRLAFHPWPVRRGRLFQSLRYRRHNPQDPLTTQAPPLRQSRSIMGGGDAWIGTVNRIQRKWNMSLCTFVSSRLR